MNTLIRETKVEDLESILRIYNQGIIDRIATLETAEKELDYMQDWFAKHGGRYTVLVAEVA